MFGTSGIRGPVGETVTASLALSVGRALAADGYETVIVGRDVRDSGQFLVEALTAGLREGGSDVIDVGVEATPTVARGVGWLDADAGVVVTASHNPAPDNGIKLWTPAGKAFGPERRQSITRCIENSAYDHAAWDELGTRSRNDTIRERHSRDLRDAVSIDGSTSVVVDLGNGTGQITARVLDDLGCSVTTLNGNPDGSFPGRESEPTAETLETLMQYVSSSDADVGIAHDGDADRMMAVDETGSFVPKDVLLALFAREAVEEGDRIAAPVDTSLAVDDALAEIGATVERTKVGDVYVAERATDPTVVFGGEPSGAWIWPDASLCPDGPLAACKLVERVADTGSLAALAESIPTYPIRRDAVSVTNKTQVIESVIERARSRFDVVDTLDGVRIEVGDGWILIRASGTQPLVRITAQARDRHRTDELFDVATELVSAGSDS